VLRQAEVEMREADRECGGEQRRESDAMVRRREVSPAHRYSSAVHSLRQPPVHVARLRVDVRSAWRCIVQRSKGFLVAVSVSILLAAAPVAAQNLLQNPDFATDLSGWTVNAGAGSIVWHPLDADGSASSGSARLTTPSAEGQTTNSIQQCVEVDGGTDYVLSAKVFRSQGVLVSAFGSVTWHAGSGCASFLGEDNLISLFAPGAGGWQEESATIGAPGAAGSAVVRLRSRREDSGALVVHFDSVVFAPDLGCVDDATALCLNQGRFRTTVMYRTRAGETGAGHAVRLTGDTGYFWFFNDANVEIVLKVLDACSTPFETFWVFAAGLTNVEVEIVVHDTETDTEKTYFNPLDRPFEPIQDTAAFTTCP
jgi:hypothetical protein